MAILCLTALLAGVYLGELQHPTEPEPATTRVATQELVQYANQHPPTSASPSVRQPTSSQPTTAASSSSVAMSRGGAAGAQRTHNAWLTVSEEPASGQTSDRLRTVAEKSASGQTTPGLTAADEKTASRQTPTASKNAAAEKSASGQTPTSSNVPAEKSASGQTPTASNAAAERTARRQTPTASNAAAEKPASEQTSAGPTPATGGTGQTVPGPAATTSPASNRVPHKALGTALIWPDPQTEESYAAIDAQALSAPPEVTTSPRRLARWLVAPARNPREKARAIFRWIAANIAYDVVAFRTKKYPDQSADNVLKLRRGICAGYSRLFYEMATAAGLEVEYISGMARTPEPHGIRNGAEGGRHGWNAVRIDGKWALVDCTWAAGSVDGGNDQRAFHRSFQPFYFMTPPSIFVANHLPNETRWQLLTRPVTEADQRRLPIMSAQAYQLGLGFHGPNPVSVRPDGVITVAMDVPSDIEIGVEIALEGTTRELQQPDVIQQRSRNSVQLLIAPYASGAYRVLVFAGSRAGDPMQFAGSVRIKANQPTVGALPTAAGNLLHRRALLVTPLHNRLRDGTTEHFALGVPGATWMGVKNGNRLTPLVLHDGRFEGDVPLQAGTAQVVVRPHLDVAWAPSLPDDSDGDEVLLEYQVVSATR